MSSYQEFAFKNYDFDVASKTITLTYGYDQALTFHETYQFNFEFADYDPTVLDRAIQHLFFIAGVSYYKAFLAPVIRVEAGEIDQATADFLSRTYERGLGEFFYVNQLDPRTPVSFPVTIEETLNTLSVSGAGELVGIGGGKDSLVSAELLRDRPHVATWSLNHQPQLTPLVERIGLPHYWVERQWDKQLLSLNDQSAYNGHVPISAIFASVGSIVAILTGHRDAIVSNESSANEPTLTYKNIAINHQYSKSLAFEQDYQALLAQSFGEGLRYYSLLRPLSELRIAELFARWFDNYADVFSSCNRAFVHTSHEMSWCGECAKCAFVFLALTPFVERTKLEKLWGKNLLLQPSLVATYKQLLGIEGDKPLDCVGEVKESRSAMRLAFTQYPELRETYEFEIPADYNYRSQAPHAIPAEIFEIIKDQI